MRYPIRLISQAVTVDTSAIVTGDNIHSSALTLGGAAPENVPSGIIRGATMITDTVSTIPYDLFIFDSAPTTTITANGAQSLSAADQAKIVAVISLASVFADGGGSVHQSGALALPFVSRDSGNLYATIVARGSVTFGAATDVVLRVYTQSVG